MGAKYELSFDNIENQIANIFDRLNDILTTSALIKSRYTRGDFPKPSIEIMGYLKNFYWWGLIKFNMSLAPMLPWYKNSNFQAYAIESMQFLGKSSLSLYAIKILRKCK